MVSVVIPVYNVAAYVERCIRSIMNQSYDDLEIIVVDDGSTDGSIEICEALAKEDERIKYIKKEHRGVVCTRNMGIEAATGKYMIFVDADDYVDPELVATMLEASGESDAVFAGFIWENDEKSIQVRHILEEGIYSGEKLKIFRKSLFRGNPYFSGNTLWRLLCITSIVKQVYQKVDTRICWGEDSCLLKAYLLQCTNIKLIAPAGYHYCVRKNEGINKRHFTSGEGEFENIERIYWCIKRIISGFSDEELLQEYLDKEFKDRIIVSARNCNINTKSYYYPYHGRLVGKRIILYGAGNVGQSYWHSIWEAKESQLVLWVDRSPCKEDGVSEITEIMKVDYDYVIVAIYDEKVYQQIRTSLVELGVPEEKILWNRTRKEAF